MVRRVVAGGAMPRYMLLLYSPSADEAQQAEREAELPLWNQLTESLREAGLLDSTDRLHAVERATTVRVRYDELELTDGPFTVNKEVHDCYYLLDCAELDSTLKHAAR